MNLKETFASAGVVLVILIIAIWLMSETKILALQDIDKQFVNHQVHTIKNSTDEIHKEVQNLNERLENLNERLKELEKLNNNLVEFNSHLRSAENLAANIQEETNQYEGVATALIEQFERLNQNLTQMHTDQIDLLNTIKKLEKRLSPFLGSK